MVDPLEAKRLAAQQMQRLKAKEKFQVSKCASRDIETSIGDPLTGVLLALYYCTQCSLDSHPLCENVGWKHFGLD